jgi:hypothetical protein
MLTLHIPITKVDAKQRLVTGVATAELPDRAGEICDYETTKPFYQKWSDAIAQSTGGRSLGNLRAMHGQVAAGKVVSLGFNDDRKQIEICAKVVDDAEWAKVEEGVYTGFSQGGTYVKRWTDDAGLRRYTAEPHEISLVDLPCLDEARFEIIKADGSLEWRRFKPRSKQLDKIGARHNAEDLERIQAMHDTSVALGATCTAEKSLGLAERDLIKRFDLFAAAIETSLADLSKRLKAIESQPQPLPLVGRTRLADRQDEMSDEDRLLADPSALALLAIKLAQRRSR